MGKNKAKQAAAKSVGEGKKPVASVAVTGAPVDLVVTKLEMMATPIDDVDALAAMGKDVVVYKVTNLSTSQLLAIMPEDVLTMGATGRGMILGVNPSTFLPVFLGHIIGARRSGNPICLIYAGVLAVAVAYTVSREWVEAYADLPAGHVFEEFEITERKAIAATATDKAVSWVAGSDMNAAALRVLGSMIVEAEGGSDFLKNLKTQAGTIFSPPTGESARDKIMKAAAKEVGEADKMALDVFKKVAYKYSGLVGAIFGGGSVDVKTYVEVADRLGEVLI